GDELLASADLGGEVLSAVATYASARPAALVIVSTLAPDPATARSYGGALSGDGTTVHASELNTGLRELAEERPNVAPLDMQLIVGRHGRERLPAPTFWYAGRIPYTTLWFEECARHVNGILDAYQSKSRKVLVVDLDGTLWGGVLGEDGPGGIELGEDGVG